MSDHAAILSLCVLLGASGVAIVWLLMKLFSVKKDLAAERLAHVNTAHTLTTTNARLSEIEKKGGEMYLELESRAYEAGYQSAIVVSLKGRISELVAQRASMNAKRFAEAKKAVAASTVEFLLAAFFPASCGRAIGV